MADVLIILTLLCRFKQFNKKLIIYFQFVFVFKFKFNHLVDVSSMKIIISLTRTSQKNGYSLTIYGL